MEHRGVKLSDKGTTSALQWSQNGGGEEEFGCADGPDEERQAAKPAEDPTRTFHIPRKSREKRALFQYVSTDSREFADILQILTSSYKDSLSIGTFVYSKPRLIHNELLEKDFMEKRRELKQDGRTEKELSETFCFLLCDAQKISAVCERGVSVGSSWMNTLGNPSKGVYLCQFSDLLQIAPLEPGSTGNIIIFKVIKGKVKSVHESMSRGMDPTPKFDSHFSKNATRVTSLQSYKSFEYTQQYFYEYVDFDISSRPRHVRPYAVVSYQLQRKEASAAPKPLPPIRSNSLSSGTSRGRRSYTVWRGQFVNGGKEVYQACLRSHSQPFLPYKLPEKIEIGKVMRLEQVKQDIPSPLFSWKLYTGSHEVCKSGVYCSMFEVVEKDKSPKSLNALLQKLEEEGLVLVNMLNNRGFLFLLSANQMANSSERQGSWTASCMHALFIYSEKRDLIKNSTNLPDACRPLSSVLCDPIIPQHDSFISALHYALSKSRSNPPADPSTVVEQHIYDYLKNLQEGKVLQRIRTDYKTTLDIRETVFPAPKKKSNWESFMRPYIYNPAMFTMILERVKKKVEELRVQTELSAVQSDPHNDPEKVKELLKLIQMKRNSKEKLSSAGEIGSPAVVEDACVLKRKMEVDTHEGNSKRHRNQLEELREAERPFGSSLANVLNTVGLQDTDLRKDKTQGALKIMEMLDSLGKTSLDTDLRREKAQGTLEVIKLIDNLTQGTTELPRNRDDMEATDISDSALFDSMLRLGLPTDRDIDLRRPFADDGPERTDCLEETSGSLSSLEAFSPCSDSGGQQRGVNLLGEKTIPWVLIPITGLKAERYSQRKMEYPEDPRFLQSPTVSTHTTPDIKDLSPPYQPDSSNIFADVDVQTVEEIESSAAAVFTDCPADAGPQLNAVDHIVDELISGFSTKVEELLRDKRIYYVSCSSTQSPREPPQRPVPPLSEYISDFNTPLPINNYISSFHDSLMLFIDSQQVKLHNTASEDVSSSSTKEVSNTPVSFPNLVNSCVSSSLPPKPSQSPTSTPPAPVTQPRHQSSPPHRDVHHLPHKVRDLDRDAVTQDIPEVNTPPESSQASGLRNLDSSSAPETTAAVEEQAVSTAMKSEDVSIEHTHSAISSIIDRLQPEVISNLVEIIKGVQKNAVYFYLHSPDEEESDVCWEIKEYLKKLGNMECSPHSFLEKSIGPDKLLVIIQNMDIAAQVHKIPALVSLKKHPSVSFAGVDNHSDIQNHTYNELFQSGGLIVSDEHVLNPDVITAEKLGDILEYLEQLNSPQSPWRWRIHFKSHKKLREKSRLTCEALSLYEILTAYEKRHIVEILSYHSCDAPSRRAPDLDCLVDLQARFIKQRHLIFLTGCRFEMFPHYSSSGIAIANVDDIKSIVSSLTGGISEKMERIPSAEISSTPAPTSLIEDSMPKDSSEDSTRVSVPSEKIQVDTEQHPFLTTESYSCVSESSVQDQPLPSTTSETEENFDFKALSEAISQFKASRMQGKSDAGETAQHSFRVYPHQSFLSHDLTDSCPLYSSQNNVLSSTAFETLGSHTESQIQSAGDCDELSPVLESGVKEFTGAQSSCSSVYGNEEITTSASSPVKVNGEVQEGTACRSEPTPMAMSFTAAENISSVSDHFKPWENSGAVNCSTDTWSGTTNSGSQSDQDSKERAVTAQGNTSSSEPTNKDKHGKSSFPPRTGNSGFGMDRFNSVSQIALQGGSLIPTPHRSTVANCPRFISPNGAIGLGHPLLNCNVPNTLGVVPVLGGLLPNPNIQMAWNSLAQGSASGFWGAQRGIDLQQMQRAQFLQTWHGNPGFQGNGFHNNRGGFSGW
ncbi:protein TASOR isoform X2 [Triplophysa rosa]|uniref:protein TASOR isoform X2 n=1 Tax=Triplophysa rosa TaxID=992332 RepID=UPI002545C964|nr:protein TASOR isoform X2 [Triplophysa rosa]